MRFESLEDAERAYKDLGKGFETLLSTMKAYHVVITSLIATHPDYNKFQLHLSAISEGYAEDHFLRNATDLERSTFRQALEGLQQIQQVRSQIGWPSEKKKHS